MADSGFYEGQDDTSLTDVLKSRRIPHSHAGKRAKGGSGRGKRGSAGAPFNPLRSLGRYEIQLGSGDHRASDEGHARGPGLSHSWLEIHELTTNDDGLMGTFDFEGRVTGMCVLAGSRKGLASIVEELERELDEDEDDDEDEDEEEDDTGVVNEHSNGESGDQADDSDNGQLHLQQSSLELEDEKINRRIRNFEKNSFRNPKFWLRWKGSVKNSGNATTEGAKISVEINTGYLIFTSNDCDKFDGTITSEALGWDNLKLRGHKVHSRPAASSMKWNDLD